MHQASLTIERLLDSFPEERENLRPYVDRAKAYANECGCTMGGVFAMVSVGLLIAYYLFFDGFGAGNLIVNGLTMATLVFSAGITGKLIGIGLARIRLALLYRQLHTRYELKRA